MGDFLPMYSEIFTFFGACLIVGGLFTAYIQNQSYHHIVLGAGLIMSGVHMAIPSLFLFSGVPHESFSILMRILFFCFPVLGIWSLLIVLSNYSHACTTYKEG